MKGYMFVKKFALASIVLAIFFIDIEPTIDFGGDINMFFVIRFSDKTDRPNKIKDHVDYILDQRSVNVMRFEF
jgi:hypothetical protein